MVCELPLGDLRSSVLLSAGWAAATVHFMGS